MLVTFYPTVSAANFARARIDRPEYFAGGVIFGSKGDKLRLPDGREWDCIVAAGGPPEGRRWQCVLIVPTGPGPENPFVLEEGPLVPIDEAGFVPPRTPPAFAALVARELAPLEGSDQILAGAAQPIAEFTGADDVDRSFHGTIEPAGVAHAATIGALDGDPIPEILQTTDDHTRVIEATRPEYEETPPGDIAEPDPGGPPGEGPENPEPGPPPA